jgi:hypothetical protein
MGSICMDDTWCEIGIEPYSPLFFIIAAGIIWAIWLILSMFID